MSDSIETIFLGLQRPTLDSVCLYLFDAFASEGCLDIPQVFVILPTQRSVRRLLESLLLRCEERGVRLVSPPLMGTAETFVGKVFADEAEDVLLAGRILYWKEALIRESDAVQTLLARSDMPETASQWFRLAVQLDDLHRELAMSLLTAASVSDQLQEDGLDAEVERWQSISMVQKTFLDLMEADGRCDMYSRRMHRVQTERFEPGRVVIAGCVDFSPLMRLLVSKNASHTSILICDEERHKKYFDSLGCVQVLKDDLDFSEVSLTDISLTEQFEEQPLAMLASIASIAEKTTPEDLIISCCNEKSWPVVSNTFAQHGLTARPAAGMYLAQTGPGESLKLVRDCLQFTLFENYAALVRHPDVIAFIMRELESRQIPLQGDPVVLFDLYHHDHLPLTLDTASIRVVSKSDEEFQKVFFLLLELLEGFAAEPRGITDWVEKTDTFLKRLYPPEHLSESEALSEQVQNTYDVLGSLVKVQKNNRFTLSGADFLELLHVMMEGNRLPVPGQAEVIDIVGWLELQFDDSTHVFISDCVEGSLPSALSGDLFLPNSLRENLGLECNARRVARDAYIIRTLLHSPKKLYFVAAKRNLDGDFVLPSRFLSAARPERLAERVSKLITRPGIKFTEVVQNESAFPVPIRVEASSVLEEVSVTSLRTYLQCPFLFYLEHVLKIRAVDDRAFEMDAMHFGSLLHAVFESFTKEGSVHSTDDKKVALEFNELLQSHASRWFGSAAEPAVFVQLEQAKQRLAIAASVHCDRVRSGWRVIDQERPFELPFVVDDSSIVLKGRIDRVEEHEKSGALALLDYKTSEAARSPDNAHRVKLGRAKDSGFEWIDLQLPAYYFSAIAQSHDIQLGYFSLGNTPADILIQIADWNKDDISATRELIQTTLLRIYRQEFWPPRSLPHVHSPIARVLQHAENDPDYWETA